MDFFRAAAAFAVVISHARDLVLTDYAGPATLAPFYAMTGLGHSAVIVFFVLSGFWISRSVLTRIGRPGFWRDYLIDRLSRLGIVLVPALLVGGMLDWAGSVALQLPVYLGQSGAHSMPGNVPGQLAWPVLLGNLAFLQTIAVPAFGSNGPLWSLAWEFWYYLWFPALVFAFMRRRPGLLLASFAVALANPAMLGGFACWLTGTALLAWRNRQALPVGPARWRGRIRAGMAALACLAALLLASRAAAIWADLLLAASFAVLLAALRSGVAALPQCLAPVAAYGRAASYSLYLIHYPALAFAAGLILPEGRMAPGAGSIVLVSSLAIGCSALAWLFAWFTERHTAGLRNRLRELGSGRT
jgi:peptidoglycan/LPS O-acetylase OafA/YrhL